MVRGGIAPDLVSVLCVLMIWYLLPTDELEMLLLNLECATKRWMTDGAVEERVDKFPSRGILFSSAA